MTARAGEGERSEQSEGASTQQSLDDCACNLLPRAQSLLLDLAPVLPRPRNPTTRALTLCGCTTRSQEANLSTPYVEIIGVVKDDLTVRMEGSIDLGERIGACGGAQEG